MKRSKKTKIKISVLKHCLKKIVSDKTNLGRDSDIRINIDEAVKPLPYLVFITLVFCLRFKFTGKHEKLAWMIPIKYNDISFVLAHRKFGFDVRLIDDTIDIKDATILAKEMILQLNKGIAIAEKLLQPIIVKQINNGHISVKNRYYYLDTKYRYFREKANYSFQSDPPPPIIKKTDDYFIPEVRTYDPMKPEREGSFYSSAMIDAYYSKLEHVLSLLAAFMIKTPGKDLTIFLKDKWQEKFKKVFQLESRLEAKEHYDKLVTIKDSYRNPLAHGFIEKDGSSILFHFPAVGALPVRLSKYKNSIHWSINPIGVSCYADVCKIFDDFDAYIAGGPSKLPMKYIKAGLLVSYDSDSVKDYQKAMKSEETFDSFIEQMSYLDDLHTNMDW